MSLFLSTSNLQSYQSDCPNLSDTIERECLSVLHKLHDQVNGLQLVQVVVQPLAKLFNPASPSSTGTYMMSPDTAQALILRLDTDRDVNWLMEIIGYGLSMPFSLTGEQDSVKDCCTIYCEWIAAALLPHNEHNEDTKYQQLSKLVPAPIKKDPNRYARKMLSHLYNVFLPRQPVSAALASKNGNQKDDSDAILTAVSRQAVLCHRVLRTIEGIAHNKTNLMDDETWNHLLALLLTVNDKLLSPPTEPDDIGTQLHDRILGVLFDLMMLACSRSIPNFSLWKTFHEMCLNWRHRPALIEHWRRITSLLTKRIVTLSRKSKLNDHYIDSTSTRNLNAIESSILSMNYESLSQTWYRFLNLIGNPVELSDPGHISKTDEFYHAACSANCVLDPRQHPCLNVLPQIFLNSMLGLREFVDSFLGSNQQINTPAPRFGHSDQNQQVERSKLNPDRPKCNSILHIFGDWLFSSALLGSELNHDLDSNDFPVGLDSSNISGSMTSMASSSTATELEPPNPSYSPAFRRKQSNQSTTSSHTSTSTTDRRRHSKQLDASVLSNKKITLDHPLTAESFEAGQAEAMSILCRIFASKSSLEDIAPAYLARFYLCIQHCLNYSGSVDSISSSPPISIKRQLLASVLMNSTELLQKDLDGINLLIPSLIKAIELVFECNEKDIPVQPPPRQHSKRDAGRNDTNSNAQRHVITSYDLRRACIMTLVNLLAYPPHFKDLAIRNCLDNASPTTTFESLQPRLMKLLFVALQTETDSTNMQILFSGLSLAIHDLKSKGSGDRPSGCGRTKSVNRLDLDSKSVDRDSDADDSSHNSFVFNSAEGLLTKSLHVTCYLLINTWRHDNSVSLAALEVLTTIARVSAALDHNESLMKQSSDANENNIAEMKAEYMQTTKWVCDYISNQCSRPPPAHSRDMHSTIVAAYQCLSVWFYNHPTLLSDENCISILMEVIELGVSGQKSKAVSINPTVGVATQTIISKGEKILKPSSMRVHEAAEALLNICLVRTCNDGLKNIAVCDTTLDETDLINLLSPNGCKSIARQMQIQNQESCNLDSYKLFRYYSDDNSIIFSLLEGQDQSRPGQDYLICLMRTPFGKHCWKFDFNYCSGKSREIILASKSIGLMKRPFQQNSYTDTGITFPFNKGHNRSIYFNREARFFPENMEELPISGLDHLVTSLDDYVRGNSDQIASAPQFLVQLAKMGKIFSHQVQAEQKVVSEISSNRDSGRRSCEEPQPMGEFDASRVIATHLGIENLLQPLGCDERSLRTLINGMRSLDNVPVRIRDTVNVFYVRRNKTAPAEIIESTIGEGTIYMDFFDCLLDFGRPIEKYTTPDKSLSLLWVDMCQELLFTIPKVPDVIATSRISVFWMESSDDIRSIPYDETHEKFVRLFISPMANGLFRVDLNPKYVPPLVDGMILRKPTLSSFIRESISNWCRRRRLDADSSQPPHVKRRLLLAELCNNLK